MNTEDGSGVWSIQKECHCSGNGKFLSSVKFKIKGNSATWHAVFLQYLSMLRYLWRRTLRLFVSLFIGLSPDLSQSFKLLCHFHLLEKKLRHGLAQQISHLGGTQQNKACNLFTLIQSSFLISMVSLIFHIRQVEIYFFIRSIKVAKMCTFIWRSWIIPPFAFFWELTWVSIHNYVCQEKSMTKINQQSNTETPPPSKNNTWFFFLK